MNAHKHTCPETLTPRNWPLCPTAVWPDCNGRGAVQSLNMSPAYLRAVCLNNVL